MPMFVVMFHVDGKELPTVLSVVEKSAKLISVTPVAEPEESKPRKHQHYVGGKRLKGIKGEDLVLKVLTEAKTPVHVDTLGEKFAECGFARHSFTSSVSNLLKAGKVVKVGTRSWALKGTVVHLGAGQK